MNKEYIIKFLKYLTEELDSFETTFEAEVSDLKEIIQICEEFLPD